MLDPYELLANFPQPLRGPLFPRVGARPLLPATVVVLVAVMGYLVLQAAVQAESSMFIF